MILDARVLQSTPESGGRAGWSGAKRRNGSKVHAAVDPLGSPLALSVTPANEDERTQVAALTTQVQTVTGEQVEIAKTTGASAVATRDLHALEEHEGAVAALASSHEQRDAGQQGKGRGTLLVDEWLRDRLTDSPQAVRGERPELVSEHSCQRRSPQDAVDGVPEPLQGLRL